jgi:hypothetical protein
VVDKGCYLELPEWLATGLKLWQELGPREGYFVAMPTADQTGIVPLAVDYMSATAMTRALHKELMVAPDDSDEVALMLPDAVSFWREHSGRHNMPSWVAALMEVPEEWVSHLGGWAVTGTASRHVGTVERRIQNMQSNVAADLRESRHGQDKVDEAGLLFSLSVFWWTTESRKRRPRSSLRD